MQPTTERQKLIRRALTALIPRAPWGDVAAIYEDAIAPHLRSEAPEGSAFLATVAHVRHQHTEYDALLDEGYELDAARHFVLDDINDVLRDWGATRRVSGEE